MGAEELRPVEEDSTRSLRKRLERARFAIESNQIEITKIEAELVRRQEPMSLEEALAELCHDQWSGWMEYLFGLCIKQEDGNVVIPSQFYNRWHRQMNTPYAELSESEQASGRREARKFSDVFERWENSLDQPIRLGKAMPKAGDF